MPDPVVSRARALPLRTFNLAANIVLLSRGLPRRPDPPVIRSQLIRCATSAAANYSAACRAQSGRAFNAKLSVAIEEADEILLWLRLLFRFGW